jgi:uncharacterized membrane protein YagU involved in acid resistance
MLVLIANIFSAVSLPIVILVVHTLFRIIFILYYSFMQKSSCQDLLKEILASNGL